MTLIRVLLTVRVTVQMIDVLYDQFSRYNRYLLLVQLMIENSKHAHIYEYIISPNTPPSPPTSALTQIDTYP
jgi:hypothetical protein